MSTAQIIVAVVLIGLVAAAGLAVRQIWRGRTARSVDLPVATTETLPHPAQDLPIAATPLPNEPLVAAPGLTVDAVEGGKPSAPHLPTCSGGSPSQHLARVRSWAYQLQDLDLDIAEASSFDLLVLDPAKDETDNPPLTAGDVARLKVKADGGRRLVLASLSIGEAESFRAYWQDDWLRRRPAWLLGESADWEGNYAVRFWSPDWQRLVFGSLDACLDQILAQGFDGVCLTGCDVADDLSDHEPEAVASRPDLDRDMAGLIVDLATYARGLQPACLVVMQNAEYLLVQTDVLAALDGVVVEDLLYGAKKPEMRNDADDVAWKRQHLDLARTRGKAVLVVEYLDDPDSIAQATEIAVGLGYPLYVADASRELARLTRPANAEPLT